MDIFIFGNEKNNEIISELNEISKLSGLVELKIYSEQLENKENNITNNSGIVFILNKQNLDDKEFIKTFKTNRNKVLIENIRFLTTSKINMDTVQEILGETFDNQDVFEYFGKQKTDRVLTNLLHSFVEREEDIVETNDKKISNHLLHLKKYSHIDNLHFSEKEWRTEYLPVGAKFGSEIIEFDKESQDSILYPKSFQQLFVAKKGPKREWASFKEGEKNVLMSLRKILQRGDSPPLDHVSEELILKSEGIDYMSGSFPGDLTPYVENKMNFSTNDLKSLWANSDLFEPRFNLDSYGEDLLFNSQEEIDFYKLFDDKPYIQKWLHPQFDLQKLLINSSAIGIGETDDQRRVDFLYSPPWGEPLAIEILGSQHFDHEKGEDPTNPESSSDFLRRKNGVDIQMLGIPAYEVREEAGDNLEKVFEIIRDGINEFGSDGDTAVVDENTGVNVNSLFTKLWETSAFNAGLYEAIVDGFFSDSSSEWVIGLRKNSDQLYGVEMFLKLFQSLCYLWNVPSFAPQKVYITDLDKNVIDVWKESENSIFGYERSEGEGKKKFEVAILLESRKSHLEGFPKIDEKLKNKKLVLLRTLNLPGFLRDSRPEISSSPIIKEGEEENLEACLKVVLNFVFRKKEFRERQFDAINNVLCKKDTLLLLPTGAGKSLVYQIISFVLPGRVLVVDPLNALMDDQADNLRRNGVDRIIPINSETAKTQQDSQVIMESVNSGDNLIMLVAPERLTIPAFHRALKNLFDGGVPISLLVLDEAHCISEWGHDFRTSYLGIGERVRNLANRYNYNPTILAMTGTASKPVVRDILIESDIDNKDEDDGTILKAESYRRNELNFSIEITPESERKSKLINVLKRKIPNHFGIRPEELFIKHSRNMDNYLGIIFVKNIYTMLQLYSSLVTDQVISEAGIGMYFGSNGVDKKRWPSKLGDQKEYKKTTARNFKDGKLRLLISTKAFGMGIDIPNIRYVIHYGISSSIETWYQEAGRAGRDRRSSFTTAIFSEKSKEESDYLLIGNEGELRNTHSKLGWSENCVQSNLWFHWSSWKGIKDELRLVAKLIDKIGSENLISKFGRNFEFKDKNTWVIRENPGKKKDDLIEVDNLIYRLHMVGLVTEWQKNYSQRSDSTYYLVLENEEAFLEFTEFKKWLKRRSPRNYNYIIEVLLELNSNHTDNFFDKLQELFSERLNIEVSDDFLSIYDGLDHFSSLLLSAVHIGLYEIYTSVESSRRRKIKELVDFSREMKTNDEIHEGFERYFTDGPAAELFNNLDANNNEDVDDWIKAYETLTIDERINSRGDINNFSDKLPANWLLVRNSIESQNKNNLSVEIIQALSETDKEYLEKDRDQKIFEWWSQCYELNENIEISTILVGAVFERFIKIEDRDIRRDYDNLTAEVLEQYFLGETEDEDSNIFTLKFMNAKLNSIKNLSKEVIDV